jgi:integrase
VRRGRDPASLKTIADLVQPDAVNEGMLFYIDRPTGKEARKHAFDIAGMLKSAARHWVKVDETHLRTLKAICKKLKPKRSGGMSQKNMARLRPLGDPQIARDFLNVAETIVSKLPRTRKPMRRDALLVQSALAIQILQMHSLRLYNLVHLNLDRHIIRSRNGIVHLAIDSDEVKNEFVIEKEFPAPTVRLLDLYLDRYRPILIEGPSPWLFPGANGKPKSDQRLREQVMENLKRYCGLDLNPHAYRHAGANIWLTRHPGQYGVVRLFLGHRSVETTTKFYCGLEAEAATRLYDETILKLRAESGQAKPPSKRSP